MRLPAITRRGAGLNVASPALWPEHPQFDVNHSQWSLALPPANPPPETDLDLDVAIIGGGFTGLSTAY